MAAVCTLLILNACAGVDLHACGHGMALKNEGDGYFCEGFGRGFRYHRTDPRGVFSRGG